MSARRPAWRRAGPPPDPVDNDTAILLALGLAGAVTVAGYLAFIVVPAWVSWGRIWERLAASFLTLFILATLLGIGGALGIAIVWSYDRFI